jgi:predicted hotdog family 3-hydroxylacyl-ACP dehydratase
MLDRRQILALIPHQGPMCLLESVEAWSDQSIVCRAISHLSASNPLRHAGALGSVVGMEYGLQAAALHGALCDGGRQRAGFLAGLRDVELFTGRLDYPALGALRITATAEMRAPAGAIYHFDVAAESGALMIRGRAVIAMRAQVA